MIVKSTTLPADSIILDLEDSVPSDSKKSARDLICKMLASLDWEKRELCVRINGLSTPFGGQDIEALGKIESLDCFVVPKSEADLSWLHNETGKGLIPLIETARGLSNIEGVAFSKGVVALSYGAGDLAANLGGAFTAYLDNPYVMTHIVVAARSCGIDPIDDVFFDVQNIKEFQRQAENAKSLGFVGKQVVHPTQVEVANKVFSASEKELLRAKKIIEAYEESQSKGKGAFRLDGELVDEVHYRAATATLKTASNQEPKSDSS
jgi:citrate lyase subunit beta / citryl-CoA lyase